MCNILTLFEFQKQFSTEEDCINYLFEYRWPQGFICPKCGCTEYYVLSRYKRFQCKQCRHQTSLTAGTVFHKSHQPLRVLFYAVYLIGTSKKGLSAMELRRKLGIKSYKTAWLLMHKIRSAMASSGTFPLDHKVEVDETYVGGYRKGARGRGANNKTLVAIAVETNGNTMGRACLEAIASAQADDLKQFTHDHIAPKTEVRTDGLKSYKFLANTYEHIPVVAKRIGNKSHLLPKVHIVVANLKMWLRGTYNSLPDRHLQHYLDEFTFRFNRRWNLENIFDKLLIRCLTTYTITYAELTG